MIERHKRHKPSRCVTCADLYNVTNVTHPYKGVTFVTQGAQEKHRREAFHSVLNIHPAKPIHSPSDANANRLAVGHQVHAREPEC